MKHKINTGFAIIVMVTLLATAMMAQQDGKTIDSKLSALTISAEAEKNKKSIEERLVEMAYKKMSILDASEHVRKAKKEKKNSDVTPDKPKLKFKISDVSVGNISEIINRRYRELVTPPTGEILQVTRIETKDGAGDARISVKTEWVPGQYASGVDPLWTIADMLGIEAVRFATVTRYASYEVKVQFEGKTRIYRALALFHNHNRPDGHLIPEILDSVSGSGGTLNQVLKERRLPVGTTKKQNKQTESAEESVRRDKEKVSPVVFTGSDKTAEFIEGGGYYCSEWDYNPFYYLELLGDPFYTECLVWDIFDPLNPPTGGGGEPGCLVIVSEIEHPQTFESERNYHASGSHMARTQFDSVCSQLATCQTNCEVNIGTSGYADTGILDERIFYHQGNSSVSRRASTVPKNVQATCETGVGYAFKRCFFDCGVEVSVSVTGQGQNASITVTGGDLWNVGHIRGRTCLNGQ